MSTREVGLDFDQALDHDISQVDSKLIDWIMPVFLPLYHMVFQIERFISYAGGPFVFVLFVLSIFGAFLWVFALLHLLICGDKDKEDKKLAKRKMLRREYAISL